MRTGVVLLALAAVAAGCGATRPLQAPGAVEGFPFHDAEAIALRVPSTAGIWQQFSAELAIAYSTPEERGSITARVAFGDSVLVRFRAALGVEVSRALLTDDSLFVYDRVHRRLYVGGRDRASALPAGLSLTDLAATLFGVVPITGAWTVRTDSSHYRLTSPDGGTELLVDPRIWRTVRIDRRDPAGMIVESLWYAEFEHFDGHLLPKRIVTSRPGDDSRASIYVRRMEQVTGAMSFDLDLPDSIERIPLR